MPGREERALSQGEVRVETVGSAPVIAGYAALFGVRANIGGKFIEQIKRGAFATSVKTDDIRALINHDPNLVIGRTKAGTHRLHEDSRGLAIEIDPPDNQIGRDLLVSMKRGDLSQMSFGFTVNPDGQRSDYDGGQLLRTLTSVKLLDTSIVCYPAYESTSAAVRGVRSAEDVARELSGDHWGLDLEYRRLQLEALEIGLRLPNETPTPEQFRSLQLKVKKLRILQV